jgi:hypothetical protein
VSALDEDKGARGVSTAELARLWASAAFRDLRAGLPPQEEEKLHRQLAAVLSGESSPSAWWATVSALRETRRAADLSTDEGARASKPLKDVR